MLWAPKTHAGILGPNELYDPTTCRRLLPEGAVEALAGAAMPAVAEIAGADSLVAVVAAARQGVDVVLPVIAPTPGEYGDVGILLDNVRRLAGFLTGRCRILAPVITHDFPFWRALSGRYIAQAVRRFGFFSPCVGCHLYLHAVRLPMAIACGVGRVISGERLRHGEKVKINQSRPAVAAYRALMRRFGVLMDLPLLNQADDLRVLDEADGQFDRAAQLGCVFSGNYLGQDGRPLISQEAVARYYSGFGLEATVALLQQRQRDPGNDGALFKVADRRFTGGEPYDAA